MKICCIFLLFLGTALGYPTVYTVEYGPRPETAPALTRIFMGAYAGLKNVYVVRDNWYYASRERADVVNADACIIPGGSTDDTPFYDGRLNSYVELLKNPGRPTFGFCAGIQFLLMARGGICARRSGEHGDQNATIFEFDEIFQNAPNPYTDRAAHNYSIADPPATYRNLAQTRTCYVTFVRHLTMPLFGSQLHIESMSNSNSAGPAILSNFQHVILPRPFHGISEVLGVPGEPGTARVTWWAAKTTDSVNYQIFYADERANLNFETPQMQTPDLSCEINGLNPNKIWYFAVRALSNAFIDTNRVIYPLQPDGHHEIVFQNDRLIDGQPYDDCAATVIYEKYPDSNYGKLGATGSDYLYWWNSGLVQFKNLEKYLAGKKIISGKVTFIFAGGVFEETNTRHVANINIFSILKPWNEGENSTSREANVGEVTWNSAQHPFISWEIPGCKGNSDRSPEAFASYEITGDGGGIAFDGTVPLPTDLIQTWVDSPDSNCGLLYEKEDTYPTNQYFTFFDNDDPWFMNHPRLVIQYLDQPEADVAAKHSATVPTSFVLAQNYPNPFNSGTKISVRIAQTEYLTIKIYNSAGELVRDIFSGQLIGNQEFSWSGRNCHEQNVASGVYLLVCQSQHTRQVRRMVLLR
jgi:GMP synthase-like glutamine amidotransferase